MCNLFFSKQVSEKRFDSDLVTQTAEPGGDLSTRERVVVQHIAEGHTNKHFSSILYLSITTIESHRAAAMRKLNITSTAGVVRYAIRNKLIEP